MGDTGDLGLSSYDHLIPGLGIPGRQGESPSAVSDSSKRTNPLPGHVPSNRVSQEDTDRLSTLSLIFHFSSSQVICHVYLPAAFGCLRRLILDGALGDSPDSRAVRAPSEENEEARLRPDDPNQSLPLPRVGKPPGRPGPLWENISCLRSVSGGL